MRPAKCRAIPPGTIGTPEAARIAGLDYRTMLRWVHRGVLHPVKVLGDGYGSAFGWDLRSLVAARAIRELRATGVSAQRVRKAAEVITRSGSDFANARLWSDGRDVFRVVNRDRLVSIVDRPGQHLIFPIHRWAEDIRKDSERVGVRLKRAG